MPSLNSSGKVPHQKGLVHLPTHCSTNPFIQNRNMTRQILFLSTVMVPRSDLDISVTIVLNLLEFEPLQHLHSCCKFLCCCWSRLQCYSLSPKTSMFRVVALCLFLFMTLASTSKFKPAQRLKQPHTGKKNPTRPLQTCLCPGRALLAISGIV